MIEIGVIVHCVEPFAEQGERTLAPAVQACDQRFHFEFLLYKADLFAQNCILEFMQELAENWIVIRRR